MVHNLKDKTPLRNIYHVNLISALNKLVQGVLLSHPL